MTMGVPRRVYDIQEKENKVPEDRKIEPKTDVGKQIINTVDGVRGSYASCRVIRGDGREVRPTC